MLNPANPGELLELLHSDDMTVPTMSNRSPVIGMTATVRA